MKPLPADRLLPPWRRLSARLTLLALLVFGALGTGLGLWLSGSNARERDGQLQWQSLNLARYIAARQPRPLIGPQGLVDRELLDGMAMYIGMIHPSLEAYVLDREGRVLHHTLGSAAQPAAAVALGPIEQALAPHAALPIYGEDPLRPAAPNVFSVAPLPLQGDQPRGYLYLILRGEQARELQASAALARNLNLIWLAAGAALAAGALLLLLVHRLVTRRVRGLLATLQDFRRADGDELPSRAHLAHARDELEQLSLITAAMQSRLQAQFQHLQDSERLRRELVSSISHDLHTPLASIQGYAETLLLREEQLAQPERHALLQTLLKNCRSLSRRVRELFELSKLESAQLRLQPEPLRIAELLSDIVQSHQGTAQERGISLRLSPRCLLDAEVMADISLIERALQNLVENALRHTAAAGWVELGVEPLSREGRDWFSISVRDNGSGIAAADLPHIFERYWSGPRPPASASAEAEQGAVSRPGSGLGLAIVKRIVELHGSRVEVRSDLHRGSVFHFALPRVG